MNYYEHHIGDYASSTRHLTMLEHGAYRLLLDLYYGTEKPIPVDPRKIFRLVVAASKAEQAAVKTILEEFFELRDDGWHNKRCDMEIMAFVDAIPSRDLKSKNSKERVQRHREERASLFRTLRLEGVAADWNESITSLRDKASRVTKTETPSVTPVTLPGTPVTLPETSPVTPPEMHLQRPSVTASQTQTQTQYSDTNVSDSALSAPSDALSAASTIFSFGVPLLVNAGTAEKHARSFLGGLRKRHGDSVVLGKLRECAQAAPLQPLEWLAAALPPEGEGDPRGAGGAIGFLAMPEPTAADFSMEAAIRAGVVKDGRLV